MTHKNHDFFIIKISKKNFSEHGCLNLFILGRQEDLIKKIEAMDSLDGNGLMWLALQDMSLPAFQSGSKTVSSIIWPRTR